MEYHNNKRNIIVTNGISLLQMEYHSNKSIIEILRYYDDLVINIMI